MNDVKLQTKSLKNKIFTFKRKKYEKILSLVAIYVQSNQACHVPQKRKVLARTFYITDSSVQRCATMSQNKNMIDNNEVQNIS